MEDELEMYWQNAEERDRELMIAQLIGMETRECNSNQPWRRNHFEEYSWRGSSNLPEVIKGLSMHSSLLKERQLSKEAKWLEKNFLDSDSSSSISWGS